MRLQRILARGVGLAFALGLAAPMAHAQFSDSYKFLNAVRQKDGTVVDKLVDEPGSTMVNTRDQVTGETALHIVVKRRDTTWLDYLLAKRANPNIRDAAGDTPLLVAARLRFADGIASLLARGAQVNQTNGRGETALILAVQARDAATVRLLLANGANPRLADRIAGMSARDYAAQDNRAAAILKLIDEAKPIRPAGAIGPSL